MKSNTNSVNKMQMSTVVINKATGDNGDKENRQRLSNRQGIQSTSDAQALTLKRNQTSEGMYRQSVTHSRQSNQGSIMITQNHQDRESGHKKSKNSEHEEKMSVGTTHRNNSQHNTNRSAKASAISSKSNGRHISAYQNSSEFTTKNVSLSQVSNKMTKKSDLDATMRDSNSKEEDIQQPAILKSSCNSKQVSEHVMSSDHSRVKPFNIDRTDKDTAIIQVQNEMEARRKNYLKNYKTKLDLNDILELRNPQSVVEFIPEIIENMRKDELNHMYPHNFLDRSFQDQISEKYRQYLVDWLAELHYKFKMWPETLYVTVGIIDKTLMNWRNFKKQDLQCLGITALHIAGKYEEIYPPELKTILGVIDNAVTREQVCKLEYDILQLLNFDMVWPSILRFMERYSMIANFNKEQQMIA